MDINEPRFAQLTRKTSINEIACEKWKFMKSVLKSTQFLVSNLSCPEQRIGLRRIAIRAKSMSASVTRNSSNADQHAANRSDRTKNGAHQRSCARRAPSARPCGTISFRNQQET